MGTEVSAKIAAPNGAGAKIAAPARPQEEESGIDEVAREALGTPEKGREGEVRRAAADRLISVDELRSVWGLRLEQLEGLRALGVVWQDGLDEKELKTIAEYRKVVKGYFMKVFGGKEIPGALFDELWKLALEGKLDLDNWNRLMKKYDLKDFKMNSSSFRVLFGNEEGFTNPNAVENIKELRQALYNLVLTIQKSLPRQGKGYEKQDAEQATRYAGVFKTYCESRNFTIIKVDKFGKAIETALRKQIGGKIKSKEDLFHKIQAGDAGNFLWDISKLAENWNEFIAVLIEKLEEAIREGLDPKSDRVQVMLSTSRRMRFVSDVLEQGEKSKYWPSLIREFTRVFVRDYYDTAGRQQQKYGINEWKTSFDYDRVKEMK